MTMKRYAIVRIYNEQCPVEEGIERICSRNGCEDCIMPKRYGDTKEQLIRKVAQALKRTLWNDKESKTYEEISKEIVEFLGVEE